MVQGRMKQGWPYILPHRPRLTPVAVIAYVVIGLSGCGSPPPATDEQVQAVQQQQQRQRELNRQAEQQIQRLDRPPTNIPAPPGH
jgi:hypothetical protein